MKRIMTILLCALLCVPMMGTLEVSAAVNVAAGKTAMASSYFGENYVPEMATDGDLNTAWSMGSEILTGKRGGYEYIGVDLGAPYYISEIRAYSRQDFDQPADRQGWLIQVSNDPKFETTVDVGRRLEAGEFKSHTAVKVELADAYRYVRVVSPSYFVVAEIEVFGEMAEAGGLRNFTDIDDPADVGPVQLLQYLGIMQGVSNTKFAPYNLLTRAEATKIAVGIAGIDNAAETDEIFADVPREHWANPWITAGVRTGQVSRDALFRPDDYVTTTEFLKLLLSAMGYTPRYVAKGGYPAGIISVSDELKLLRGTGAEYGEPLNRISAAYVIYNGLKSEVLSMDTLYPDGAVKYEKDETLMEARYRCTLESGLVTANCVTTLTAPTKMSDGCVQIDYKKYVDATDSVQHYLGQRIYYLTEIDDKDTIQLFWADTQKNMITTVRTGSMEKLLDGSLSYWKDGYRENIKWKTGVSVLLNGVAFPGWKLDDLKPENGYLEFIDNNGDLIADVVKIFRPEVIVLDTASNEDGYVSLNGMNGVRIKAETPDYFVVKNQGRNSDISAMSQYDAVYAYQSEDKRSLIVDFASNQITGVAEELSDESIKIDGKVRGVSQYFRTHRGEMEGLLTGDERTFVFDVYDDLLWVRNADFENQKETLGLIVGFSEQGMDELDVRIFDQYGKFVVFPVAQKLKVDGTQLKRQNFRDSVEKENYLNLFVRYRTNAEGEINFLDTERYYPELEPDSRMVKSDVEVLPSHEYIMGVNGIYDRNMMKLPVMSNTLAFEIPTTDSYVNAEADFEMYFRAGTISQIFPNQNPIEGKSAYYGQDEFGFPAFVVLYTERQTIMGGSLTSINNDNAPGIVVDKAVSCVDEDGSTALKLYGYDISTGKAAEQIIPSTIENMYDSFLIQQEHPEWLSDRWMLKPSEFGEGIENYIRPVNAIGHGDIVRYQSSGEKVVALERVFDFQDEPIESYSSADGSFYNAGTNPNWPFTAFKLLYGNMTSISENKLSMNTSSGNSETFVFDEIPTLLYVTRDKIIKKPIASLHSLLEEDTRVMLYTQRSQHLAVVVYDYAD